jgi:transcriptional regulator with XRE-family HTH domain
MAHDGFDWMEWMAGDHAKFVKDLGQRIAHLRKEHGLTQGQLAEVLGISQQQVASFEGGRRRVPVALLPALAKALAVAVHELVDHSAGVAKRGPTPKLQRQLERVSRLPKAKQKFVSEMLETVLQQAGS